MSDRGGPTDPFAATQSFVALRVGEVLAHRYELLEPLGQGGMGIVWRALDRVLEEEIALKVLAARGAIDPEAALRFRREVKLARRVTHPNVARTYDLGHDRGIHFFTMELIRGESLTARMRRRVPLAEILRITAAIARGLAASHALGVVHRDLKPDNVMLTGERVLVTDFGIARSADDALATSGMVVGTPAYMAPEQLEAHGVDGRADVFALGVVLYEAIAGRLPFQGDSPFAVAAARLADNAPDLATIAPGVPEVVARLVQSTLARHRENRPDAQTLAERLDEIRVGGVAHITPAGRTPSIGDVVRDGRSIALRALESVGDMTPFARDLDRAIADAVAAEKRIRVVTDDADLVLSGDIRAAGQRVRVRSRIATRDGVVRWSSHVDGDRSDPFVLEDALVAQLSAAVRGLAMPRQVPADSRLHERFEKARALVAELHPEGWHEAIAILDALSRESAGDPAVGALTALAMTQVWMVAAQGTTPDFAARAEELALRALEREPDLLDGYLAITTLRRATGDYRGAVSSLRQALSRSPSFATAHHTLGRLLCETGHVEAGMRRIEVARRLGIGGGLALSIEVRLRAMLGDETWVRAQLASVRGTATASSLMPIVGELAAWWNDRDLARETADEFERPGWGGSWRLTVPLLRAFAEGGALTERLTIPATATTSWSRTRVGMIVTSYAIRFGQIDAALESLGVVAAEPTFVELLWLDRAPTLEALREHPQFAAARARVAARVADIGW